MGVVERKRYILPFDVNFVRVYPSMKRGLKVISDDQDHFSSASSSMKRGLKVDIAAITLSSSTSYLDEKRIESSELALIGLSSRIFVSMKRGLKEEFFKCTRCFLLLYLDEKRIERKRS